MIIIYITEPTVSENEFESHLEAVPLTTAASGCRANVSNTRTESSFQPK